MTWPSHMTPSARRSSLGSGIAGLLLLAPAGILLLDSTHHEGMARSVNIGVAVTIAVEGLFLITRYGPFQAASSLFGIAFYGMAAIVLRFNSPDLSSPETHALLAATLLAPVVIFVRREVSTTGGNARQVKFLISRLLRDAIAPESFAQYRTCPLIQSLAKGFARTPRLYCRCSRTKMCEFRWPP